MSSHKKRLAQNPPSLLRGVYHEAHIPIEYEDLVEKAANELQDFSYRAIQRWIARFRGNMPDIAYTGLLNCIVSLKWHCANIPTSTPLCMYLLHHHVTRAGVEAYEEFFPKYALYRDRKTAGVVPSEEERAVADSLLFKNERCPYKGKTLPFRVGATGPINRIPTMEYPSINCLPTYEWDKPSKMPLTDLEELDPELQDEFRMGFRQTLLDCGLQDLEVPNFNSWVHCSGNLYADGPNLRKDHEEPEISWESPFIYQRFWTSPTSQREVWVPSKAYKMTSTYWHLISQQFVEKLPEMVGNETILEIRDSLMKRFKPSLEIDLKGFGIQFPRSMLKIAIEEIIRLYPNKDLQLYGDYAKFLLDKISILMPDGTYKVPTRGKGLGYFETLAALCIRSILKKWDVNIIKMFHDDILISLDTSESATEALHYFKLVVKPERVVWYEEPYFLNCRMTKTGIVFFHAASADLNAVIRQKYHYQRKSLFLMTRLNNRWRAAFHYTRIFGYELNPFEVYDHPEKWGLNTQATSYDGWVTGGILKKFRSPMSVDVMRDRLASYYFPFGKRTKVNFQALRIKAKKLKKRKTYTWLDDYLHPYGESSPWQVQLKKGFLTNSKYYTPYWYDLRNLLRSGVTTGRALRGLTPDDARDAIARYCLFPDPIGIARAGGVTALSKVTMRIPCLTEEQSALYNAIMNCKLRSTNLATRVDEPTEVITLQEDIIPTNTQEVVLKILQESLSQDESTTLPDQEEEISTYLESFLDKSINPNMYESDMEGSEIDESYLIDLTLDLE
jgi:hypothetical protein